MASNQHQVIYKGRKFIPRVGTEDVCRNTVGDMQQLLFIPHRSDTDGNHGYGRYLRDGVLNGPIEIGKKAGSTLSLGGTFGTSGTTDGVWDTLRFTSRVTDKVSGRIFLQDLVVVTVSQHNENLGSILSETGGADAGQHVGSVYDTGADRGTRTAANSRGNTATVDFALSFRIALQSTSSVLNAVGVVSLSQGDGTVPRDGVEVGDTEVNTKRRILETVHQVLRKFFLKGELDLVDGR